MKRKGFTLIELLIVIAIIGIVAAIAIPNLMVALHKGKQKSTMGNMKIIGTAVESYIIDNYISPGGGGNLIVASLLPILIPFHTSALPIKDHWGADFQFFSGAIGSGTEDHYSIVSYGRGNTPGVIDINNNHYEVTSIAHFNNDICFSLGSFTYGPKIK